MNFLVAEQGMSANPSGVPFIRLWLMVVGLLPFIVIEAGLCSSFAQSQIADVSPQPAAKYITAAFDRYPLVAFSEPHHGASGTKEFLSTLIRQPGFAGKVSQGGRRRSPWGLARVAGDRPHGRRIRL